MATFGYAHVVYYFDLTAPIGDGAFFIQTNTVSGTLDDSDPFPDTTFEAGDVVTGVNSSGLPVSINYLGTTVIDGETWPVFYDAASFEVAVYMSQAPVIVPNPLQVNEDDTLIVCFAAGTLISTPAGAVAVEALAPGDLVTTANGRDVPVKWIGHQTCSPRFSRLSLIRVAAGALGNGLPLRDLTLTADHALMIDGLLVNAGALVNGTTITEVADLPERVTIYHVETADHDIILAEGMPAETFIDYAGRQAFDNHAEYVALYGEDRTMVENQAPRITAARMLPAALQERLRLTRAA